MSELSDSGQVQQPALDVSLSVSGQSALAPSAVPSLEPVLPVTVSADVTNGAQPASLLAGPVAEAERPMLADDPLRTGPSSPTARAITPLLRLWRLVSGAALLGLAWSFLLVLVALGNAVWGFLQSPQVLVVRAAAGAGAIIAALWLALAVIACVFAGAYCLMLAVTRRSW